MPASSSPSVSGEATRRLPHIVGLDGLRGLAVAAVVLYHLGDADDLTVLRRLAGGGLLGVSAFFTLSGFLITSLLLVEHSNSGHVDVRRFWARRFRRLLPASLLTLLVVALLTPYLGTAEQLKNLPAEIWAALADVVNWRFIVAGSDYAAAFHGAPSPIKHFWSLAVEEQIYFVLPIVVGLALRFGRGRRTTSLVLAALAVGSTVAMIAIGGGHYTNRVYLGTDTRVAELAIGALLAVALSARTSSAAANDAGVRPPGGRLGNAVGRWLGPPALLFVVGSWTAARLQQDWLYRGGFQLHAVAVAVVIGAVTLPANRLTPMLSMTPLVWLGRISYGVYLFHWPILRWLTAERLHLGGWPTALVQVALTVLLAAASYRWFEQPIRTGRRLVGWRSGVVPVTAIAIVALVAALLPAPRSDELLALPTSGHTVIPTTATSQAAPAGAPTTAAPPPPVRVMIAGDSYALSVGLGLEHVAESTGTIATLNRGIVGCGFGRGGKNRGIGLEREWPDDCKLRDANWDVALNQFHPDVVLLAGGMWDVTDRQLKAGDRWRHVGDPRYDDYLIGEFQYVTDFFTQRGVKVVWTNAPDWNPRYTPGTYMGKPPYAEARAGRAQRYNELLATAVASRPGTLEIDMATWVQSQPGGEFDRNLRVDGVHLTEAAADRCAQWLTPQLIAAARGS